MPTAEGRQCRAITFLLGAIVFLAIFVGWSVLRLVGLA